MKYRTIVADPPWPFDEGFVYLGTNHLIRGRRRTVAEMDRPTHKPLPYLSMTVENITRLPVASIADRDARLFLWAPSRYLPAAIQVLAAWGFRYRQTVVWDKRPNFNPVAGSVAANAAEFLVVGVCGAPRRQAIWSSSVITARKPRTTHSVKPDVFIDFIETVSPGPYVELFARRHRLGWDVWGNESANTAQLGEPA